MKLPPFLPLLFALLIGQFVGQLVMWPTPLHAQAAGDLLSPASSLESCVAVDGAVNATPAIRPMACTGADSQRWQVDVDNKWHSGLDANYCLARKSSGSWTLTTRLCTDTLALQLVADAANSAVYVLRSDASLAMDNYGSEVGLYSKHSGSNQQWRWFQPDVDVVNNQGCTIPYPFAASDTATYQRELSCHRVSSMQPPYTMPANAVRSNAFPGAVANNLPTVTQNVSFDLTFKDHGYLRMAAAPRNWKTMGLYAPPNQVLQVTVNNAITSELSDVYVQIGVHTDRLTPTSGNVAGGQFLRNPSVVVRIRLLPGENVVRSPYGGPVVLISERSQNKLLNVTIANAVQAPYFALGQTTEAEWLARRSAQTPFAEIEGPQMVSHVPSSEISNLSFADITAVAQYYEQMVDLHNQLAGLSANAALPHQTPQGQHRQVEDIQISAGWGHSGFPIMYYTAWQIAVPNESIYRSTGWGMWHELGHNYQMGAWSYVYGTEVTVNLFSLFAQEQMFGNSRLIDSNSYADAITILNNPAITNKWGSAGAFEQLVFHDQMRLAFPQINWNLWSQLMRRYREMSSTDYNALNTDQKKRDKFLELICEITNSDLTPHFNAWTIVTSQTSKDFCATKPALAQQIWLVDGAKAIQPGTGAGQILHEVWNNISGSNILSLTNNSAYPNNPSSSGWITTGVEAASNVADSYGQRLRGYLHPPLSGDYRFWIAGDNSAQFGSTGIQGVAKERKIE